MIPDVSPEEHKDKGWGQERIQRDFHGMLEMYIFNTL